RRAKGSRDGPSRAYAIDASDQLSSAPQYKSVVVAYRNGAPIYLSDVADVVDGAENARLAAWMNEVPAVILNIQRQPGANVIEVVDRIKQQLPQLQASLPASIDVAVLTDRTVTIRASVHDVQVELLLAVALVVAVIFVSAVVSLTLTPMMCARLLRPEREDQSRFSAWSGRAFDRIIHRYGQALDWVLDRQPMTLLVWLAALLLTVLLYFMVPKGFFP